MSGLGLAKGLAVTLRTMTRRSHTRQYPDVEDWTEWLAGDDEAAAELRTPLPPRIITRLREGMLGELGCA